MPLTAGGNTGTVSVTPTGGSNIKYSSSNQTVATVNEDTGVVTPLTAGTTNITATVNGTAASGQCAVTVTPATTTITLSTSTLSLTAGGAAANVTVTVMQGNNPVTAGTIGFDTVTSNPSTGVILTPSLSSSTLNNLGQTTITVTSGNTAGTATIPVVFTSGGVSKTANLTVNVTGSGVVAALAPYGGTPNNGTTLYLDNWYDYNNSNSRTFILTPSLTINGLAQSAGTYSVSYEWALNGVRVQYPNVSSPYSYTLYSNSLAYGTNNTLTCTATFTYGNGQTTTATYTCYINAGYSNALASATVSGSSGSYSLGEADDAGRSSIASQLESAFYNPASNRYGLRSVRFGSATSGTTGSLSASTGYDYYTSRYVSGTNYRALADVLFYPGTTKGTASFPITVYYYINNSYTQTNYVSGSIVFNVTDAATGDITYTASIGDDVYFDIGDFDDFYYTKTSRGTLDRVAFTLPSGGNLYADGGRLSSGNVCYASPRNNQNDLSTVYFSPSGTTASRAGTVRINFTAYGNKNSVGGTVAITYLNGAAKDINYSAINGTVTLNPQDFINAYQEVTGKTAPSGLTIQFQEVPTNGALTYTGGTRDVELTRSNVRSNKYTTRTTGSYRLDQLKYSGTRGTDTIEYIAYNGGAAQFTGKVVFNSAGAVPTDVVVTYGSTGGQAVTFSQNDFIRANSAISNAAKLRFVASSNGALTMNGANAAGVDVLPSLLGSVSYKPRAGFNGTDKIIFAAYDARGNVVASGNVNITVVGNSGGSTGGNTGAGGVTDVSQFKDVSSSAWYRSDLATLVSQGIITGKGEGKFDPLGTVTYGEALKMILEACGHTAALGTGSNWAINYKNLAVSNGWISSSIDLNAAISRNATAELAAKVLGVAQATGSSPFADDANAYAVALYYTSPQIFVGDNTTGKLLFKNGSPLLRQEVCAVICRVRNYHTQHNANTMPDGL